MTKNDNWVNFQEIKEKIPISFVLERYGIMNDLKRSGSNLVGCCPIHKGTNPRQFSVNPERNIWNCFGDCQSGGNILDFVSKMEGVDTRQAGLMLKEWYGQASPRPAEPRKTVRAKPEIINAPLKFQLKGLKTDHEFFARYGIMPETVEYFGLGFCTRGIMKNRIAIPIHNEVGQLVAYCGRAVTDEQNEREGKYKLPPKFVKSAVVYNLHRQIENTNTLILVESYLSVFNLHQYGFPNTVALMGSALSESQEEQITETVGSQGQVILMFDADESGEVCANDCLERLSHNLFVKRLNISAYARKPHQLSFQELTRLI